MHGHIFNSPVGPLYLQEEDGRLVGLSFESASYEAGEETASYSEAPPLLLEAERQLRAYFSGRLRAFDLPLRPEGTPFMRRVWSELERIPYGGTASYKDIARRMGNPGACRAVGMANHRNPVAIIIPCHRVIGSGNTLGGYAGGLEIKKTLLRLEGLSF
ncbi:MAG: methylated-DNA--[protein]-cysteine S-methyltransferase [Deltaproteobacteria bacterium]|jgi:methylated-DNA-[protein]-cysteine S-methyltransferase|nr:methylated-DNA--[protein]-cysteine S-methyltransferase [Deltaproteobacteria bacterium]